MHFSTMNEWLNWISSIHITEIELGLDRVKRVAAKLNLLEPTCPVIIVGGTNGKGSCVAGLEAIYQAAGYKVGAFTTPLLFKYNEQVRICGKLASNEEFCQAFEKIEAARGDISLTPFEFSALSALIICRSYPLDVLILEVGLGGRLDAVNIMDADVAVVTSISIDHVEWLGSTREKIAYEKAGIFRKDKPAVCGDIDPPATLMEYAARIGAPLFCQNKDFRFTEEGKNWSWVYQDVQYQHLPFNSLATQNMAVVLMVVTLLQQRLPVARDAIEKGLLGVKILGRIQIIDGPVVEIYDVSHNPASVALLAKRLSEMACAGKTHGVFSMLEDKDMAESIRMIKGAIDNWYIAPLKGKRAASSDALMHAFTQVGIHATAFFMKIEEAYDFAVSVALPQDRIVIFGSFRTVADVMRHSHPDFEVR